MQIIIPMSWTWERFKNAWYNESKYLLRIEWKTILEKIIYNFDKKNDIFLFICNKEDYKKNNLKEILDWLSINYDLVVIDIHKYWPAYSLKKAELYINKKLPTIVNYCDFYWKWDYSKFKNKIKNYDWAIVCYKWFHPHLIHPNLYAWVKVNGNKELIEIKEKYSYTKNKMDTWQSSWTYYFKNWETLIKYTNELIKNHIKCNDEFYISLIYNLLKKDWLNTIIYNIDKFLQLWTPKDYKEYKYFENIFNPKDEHILFKP